MATPVEEFESLKATIDELKVRQLSAQREKERLEKELEELKTRIKEEYGVEITDFEKAIGQLRGELATGLEELKRAIAACREKMEGI